MQPSDKQALEGVRGKLAICCGGCPFTDYRVMDAEATGTSHNNRQVNPDFPDSIHKSMSLTHNGAA
jgi:hypothetical protein